MRICTAVAALIGQAFAQHADVCGAATLLDQTSLLQNLQIQKNVVIQAVGELQTTSAEHMFDQAVVMWQNVQTTPGIATFADDIRSQITADDGFLAAIQAAHASDQFLLVGLWAEVVSSMNAAQDKIKDIENLQSDVGIVATSHVICRQDESPLCIEVDDCHVRLEAAEAELATAEAVVSSTQTAIKTSWCGNDGVMQLAFRDGARPMLSTYLGQEIIADTKRTARDAVHSECEAKEVLRLSKRGECNSVQVNFEVQSCQLATLISHSLDLTEQQVHAAITAYQAARTDVEAQEEIRKKEFLTLTRTECLLDRIHEAGELPCDENTLNQSDVAAQATACHNIEVDTSTLVITYNDVQTVPPFPAVPSSPCDGDFISSHYDDLIDRFSSCGGPHECAPCENAPEPTPAPPSGEHQWTLVLKSSGDSVLGYSSSYWTDNSLLNEASPTFEAANAKYAAFNEVPFNMIKVCVGNPRTNCLEHTLSSEYSSALSLFSAEFIRDETIDKDELLHTLGVAPGSYRDCPMQRPGFNLYCGGPSNKARFGFCANCPSQPCQGDDGDADGTFGIGLAGQHSDEIGAGWTNYVAGGAGTCLRSTGPTPKNMWLWVGS